MEIVETIRKEKMQRPGKMEDVKKKIYARTWKVLHHRVGNAVWAGGCGRELVSVRSKKFYVGERRAERVAYSTGKDTR